MSSYAVDIDGVRSVLATVGVEGATVAEVRASTRDSMGDAAAACGSSAGVAAAMRRLRDNVGDGHDAVEQHVGACVSAVVQASVSYEFADVQMADSTNAASARSSAGG